MRPTPPFRHVWIAVPLMLFVLACNITGPPQVATPTLAPLEAPVIPPAIDTPTPVFKGAMPVGLPAGRADQAGDIDSSANAHKALVSGGDVFVHGLYERPFNADPMDKYFAYLDIVDTQGFKDDTWGYATITLQGTDPNGALPAHYAVELDLARDGRGDWLIRVTSPASTDWTRQGVQAWRNANDDIGGVAILAADSHPRGGDGYEQTVFDQGDGGLTDGAWARIEPDDPKTVELAFKLSMLGDPTSYAMGAWAGTLIDPAMFDHHDHMTHIQAGSPNPGYEVYPLKELSEIDNTCRLAIGFAPTGKEPGLCTTVEQRVREGEGVACHTETRCTGGIAAHFCEELVVCP